MKNLFRYFIYALLSFTVISCANTGAGCNKSKSCCKTTEQKACSKGSEKKACCSSKGGEKKACCSKNSEKACSKK